MDKRHIFEQVFTLESIIAGVVFTAVLGAVGWALVRRRASSGVSPSPLSERSTLESYYLAALAAVTVFLVVYTAWQNREEHREPTAAQVPTVRVGVSGFQWCWSFSHKQESRKPVSVTGTCRERDALPTLVVPTGRPVELELTSKDVIHSLWVPELRYKMDAFPHHVNSFTLQLDHEGEWLGRCAEFCGNRHVFMDFKLRAVSPGEYEQWLGAQASAGSAAAAV